jgi:hypothetical protein
MFRLTEPGMPVEGEADGPRFHELCGTCHDGESGFDVEEECSYCHGE